MPPEYNIRSVDRALAVLDCYDLEHTSFSLVELAKKIILSRFQNCPTREQYFFQLRYLSDRAAILAGTLYKIQ